MNKWGIPSMRDIDSVTKKLKGGRPYSATIEVYFNGLAWKFWYYYSLERDLRKAGRDDLADKYRDEGEEYTRKFRYLRDWLGGSPTAWDDATRGHWYDVTMSNASMQAFDDAKKLLAL